MSIPKVQFAAETPNFSVPPRSAGILHLQAMQKKLFLVKAVYCMTWLKSEQRLLTAFHEICSHETTVNSAEIWLFFL